MPAYALGREDHSELSMCECARGSKESANAGASKVTTTGFPTMRTSASVGNVRVQRTLRFGRPLLQKEVMLILN